MTQRNRSDPTLGNPSFDIMIVGGGGIIGSKKNVYPIITKRFETASHDDRSDRSRGKRIPRV